MKNKKVNFIKSPFGHVKYILVRNQAQLDRASKGICDFNFLDCGGCAQLSTYYVQGGIAYCFLQIGDTSNWGPNSVVSTLVHECIHIWQVIKKRMSEDEPSAEFEAYSIENIFSNVLKLYDMSSSA